MTTAYRHPDAAPEPWPFGEMDPLQARRHLQQRDALRAREAARITAAAAQARQQLSQRACCVVACAVLAACGAGSPAPAEDAPSEPTTQPRDAERPALCRERPESCR